MHGFQAGRDYRMIFQSGLLIRCSLLNAGIRTFKGRFLLQDQVSPCLARYFLLRAQEKVPKEKGTRRPRRLTPMPCVPRRSGGAHNSAAPVGSASDRMRALIPERLRYSARPTGPGLSSPARRSD